VSGARRRRAGPSSAGRLAPGWENLGMRSDARDERDLRSVHHAADGIAARRVVPLRLFRGYAQLGGAGMPPAEPSSLKHDTWGAPHPKAAAAAPPGPNRRI
jgi:hypothetical protein